MFAAVPPVELLPPNHGLSYLIHTEKDYDARKKFAKLKDKSHRKELDSRTASQDLDSG